MTSAMHVERRWTEKLNSPLFDAVRIPGRQSMVRLIERVCAEHGTNIDAFKANRARFPSNEVLSIRRDILIAAKEAKFGPSQIAYWFAHRDSTTVIQWYADLVEPSDD